MINLVEIDLTRSGDRSAIMPWITRLKDPQPTYVAGIHRRFGRRRPTIECYTLPLEQALKPIAIPLRPQDEDVVLNLQPLLEQAYERGRYYNVDYRKRLSPPLSQSEQQFLERQLALRPTVNDSPDDA